MTASTRFDRRQLGVDILFAFLLLAMWLNARFVYFPHAGFRAWAPATISGDEPHYLMVVHSILFDGDLAMADEYRHVDEGGWEAGRRYRGLTLDHHTILVDPDTGREELWSRVFDPDKRIPCEPDATCVGFARTSRPFDGAARWIERPAHPPIFPALAALLIAPARPSPASVEPHVSDVVIGIAWLGALLTYLVARREGLGVGPSLWAAALLLLASPWTAYSRSFFSEPLAGTALIAGLLALRAGRPACAGLAVGLAAATKLPFLLVGIGWVLERCWARKPREAAWVAGSTAASAVALMTFNFWLARTPFVSGSLGWDAIDRASQLPQTLLDPSHGLLPFAPWAVLSFAGLFLAARSSPDSNATALRPIATAVGPYLLLLMVHEPLGGTCFGPRYWVPLLPWLAVAAVSFVARRAAGWKWAALGFGLAGLLATLPGTLAYPRVWDRTAWLLWQ